jgi:ABC-type antimicrobial peptide transport system permease subunit
MAEAIAKRYADRQGLWILTVSMGGLALVLSLLGLYGIVSYSIAAQTKEFGIRLALGAGQRTILLQATAYWTKISLLGIAAGLPVALLLSPYLQGLLYDVSPYDFLAYGVVAGFLVLALTLVIYGSARAVTRVDLTKALRND